MQTEDILFVRLTEAEKRRIKTLAVSQGLTLRQAILQAFEAWAEKLQSGGAPPLDPSPSARAHTGYEKPRQPKRGSQATPLQGRRPANGAPSSTPGQRSCHCR